MTTTTKYELSDEHRAMLPAWRDRWIANAMQTSAKPYGAKRRKEAIDAVKGLYAAANLTPPTNDNIVFVSSPMQLRFLGGFAAALLQLGKSVNLRDLVANASDAPTSPQPQWYTDQSHMIDYAIRLGGEENAELLLRCALNSYNMWNSGNQWSGWVAFLSFFRHVAKLPLDYSKWQYYETLATFGPRIMYEKFCMISELPTKLTVDAQNRPHCDNGAFCEWLDGSALYSVHGVRLPGYIVTHPETITLDAINAQQNVEIKRIMIDRYGLSRYVSDSKFAVVDSDNDSAGQPRRLLRAPDGMLFVELTNSTADVDGTRRKYHIPCQRDLRPFGRVGTWDGSTQPLTALNAVASTYGLTGAEYAKIEIET